MSTNILASTHKEKGMKGKRQEKAANWAGFSSNKNQREQKKSVRMNCGWPEDVRTGMTLIISLKPNAKFWRASKIREAHRT